MTNYIDVWERIGFNKDGDATSWERSFDKGKTWERVEWLGGALPFVLLNPDEMLRVTHVIRVDRKAT